MKKIYDAVCTVGEYQKNGETKKRYLTVGAVFENDQGAQSMKLECVPVGFSGWINFYQPKSKEQSTPQQAVQDEFKSAAKASFDDMDSSIPF